MLTLINILPILKKHFESLKKDAHTANIIVLFFVIPLIISYGFLHYNLLISKGIVSSLISALSILIGFIMNVLILLIRTEKEEKHIRNELIEHVCYNALYELITGLLILMLCILTAIIYPKANYTTLWWLSFVIYFLTFNFLFTLFMVAKRLYVIFYLKINTSNAGIRT